MNRYRKYVHSLSDKKIFVHYFQNYDLNETLQYIYMNLLLQRYIFKKIFLKKFLINSISQNQCIIMNDNFTKCLIFNIQKLTHN